MGDNFHASDGDQNPGHLDDGAAAIYQASGILMVRRQTTVAQALDFLLESAWCLGVNTEALARCVVGSTASPTR